MYHNERVAALIVAAGSGTRMGPGTPKQYIPINGKTALQRSTEAFEQNAFVDDIYVVTDDAHVDGCRETWTGRSDSGKVRAVVPGGATRQASVGAGLAALSGAADLVLIHDAVRPFVTQACIDRVTAAAAETGAAAAAVPVKDTIKAALGGVFTKTFDRNILYAMQTPQGFRRDVILRAHAAAETAGRAGTDDATLVEMMAEKVWLVEGDYENIKLTTPEDIRAGQSLAEVREGPAARTDERRVGTGYDVHRFRAGGVLVLGGLEIPFEKSLAGHSDADVLTHAVMDALLGAAGLDDIGCWFPDTDPAYAGACSVDLLRQVARMVAARGYVLENADAVVVAERPRLAPYVAAMRARLAGVLDVPPERIGIKATTTEGLGFAGREEGVAAQAVVLLRRK
jgi:2-C-methyl-D-erythritol 4-phosphate cytidylyltransferase/2-C-methyl-D-erythritol 2,4-cyclodiphosphate synthase